MKFIITPIFLLISLNCFCQSKITSEELKKIIGKWEGSITYLDYRSNKPFTMPANLVVKQGNDEYSLVLNNIYPKEPKANNSDKIKISKNGLFLNKHMVTSRKILENGQIQIQTEHEAKDDRKKARIRYTFIISSEVFIIRKDVQFEDKTEWIKRSEFNYQRKN